MMSKVLLRLISVVVILSIFVTGLVYYCSEFILERFRTQIQSEIGDLLNGQFEYERARILLIPTAKIVLMNANFKPKTTTTGTSVKVSAGKIAMQPTLSSIWRHTLESLVLHASNLNIFVLKGDIKLELREFEVQSMMQRLDERIELKELSAYGELLTFKTERSISQQKTDLRVENLIFDAQAGSTSLANAQLKLGATQVGLHQANVLGTGVITGKLSVKSPEIREEMNRLKTFFPRHGFDNSHGKLDLKLSFSVLGETTNIESEGVVEKLMLSDIGLKLDKFKFSRLKLSQTTGGPFKLTLNPELTGFSIDLSDGTKYRTNSALGDISIARDKSSNSKVNGNLQIRDFIFIDPGIEIRNINADLEKIRTSLSSEGDVDVQVDLNGKSIDLTTDTLEIRSSSPVRAPGLRITVPNNGGYKVSGVADVSRATMKIQGRDVENLSGKVDVLVSGPFKRFFSNNLSADRSTHQVKAKADFAILPNEYQLRTLNADIASGQLTGKFVLGRKANRIFNADATISKADLKTLQQIFLTEDGPSHEGILDTFTVGVTGVKGALLSSLSGRGFITLQNGSTKTLRVDSKLAQLLRSIPLLGEGFALTPLADGKSNSFKLENALARRLKANFVIKDGAITTEDLKMKGRYGTVEASGQYKFEDALNLKASVIFLEQNARTLGGPVKPLRWLFGNLGKIQIPLLIEGKISEPSISADTSRLASATFPGRVLESVFGTIGSAFSSSDGPKGTE